MHKWKLHIYICAQTEASCTNRSFIYACALMETSYMCVNGKLIYKCTHVET